MTFWGNSKPLIKTMRNQQKCSYGPSWVQLKFNFQILNVQKLYKFSKFVKRKNTKSPWESCV